jgi:hypothetical protein
MKNVENWTFAKHPVIANLMSFLVQADRLLSQDPVSPRSKNTLSVLVIKNVI